MEKAGVLKLTVTGLDTELIEAVALRIIELTGQKIKDIEEMTYTVDEVAKLKEKSTQTIRLHINNGLLKAHKVGKPWVIKESNLKLYLDGK